MPRAQQPVAALRPALVRSLDEPADADARTELRPALPADHPRWQRDVLAVSARVRGLLIALPPVVVRAMSFWEHAVTALAIGGQRLEVGPCGCYRLR